MKFKAFLFSLLVLLAIGQSSSVAQEGLEAYWAFDEGGGNVLLDSSGNGRDGTIMDNFQAIPGVFGSALQMNGVSGERIEVAGYDGILGTSDRTVVAWINTTDVGDIISWGVNTNTLKWIFRVQTGQGVTGAIRTEASGGYIVATTDVRDGEWHHVASVLASNGAPTILDVDMYVDGVLEAISASQSVGVDTTTRTVWIGDGHHDRPFPGAMDDLAIFSRALSQEEIVSIMSGFGQKELASKPIPENEASGVLRDTMLSWASGEFAQKHNVYFGTVFEDVNTANVANPKNVLIRQDLGDNGLGVGRLDFDQTYYWRVDEVNGAPDRTVFKGIPWRFTVEPFSVPIANVTATASSTFGLSLPENTINGSGLVDDLHSAVTADMWISTGIPATLEYAFDKVYKMHELWVWNSNQTIEPFIGFGAKDVSIETSVDGQTWAPLAGVSPLAQAPGTDGYAHNSVIDFQGVSAQYVRMTINSVHGFAPQTSLSEVRFFAIPTFATRADPSPGAVDRAHLMLHFPSASIT